MDEATAKLMAEQGRLAQHPAFLSEEDTAG